MIIHLETDNEDDQTCFCNIQLQAKYHNTCGIQGSVSTGGGTGTVIVTPNWLTVLSGPVIQ